MNISGLFLGAGAVATIEGCIRLWANSPPLAIAPLVGFGLLFGLLLILNSAPASFMVGNAEYSPESNSGAPSAIFAWTLAGVVLLFGSLARLFEASTDRDLRFTGPEISGWTIWGMALVITIQWAAFLWGQHRSGTLRVELRNLSTAGPARWEVGVVSGLVASLCTVFLLDLHPLRMLWLMPALMIVTSMVCVLVGRLLPKST